MTDMNKERKVFIEAMKKNGCPMWMFERDENGNFEDMGMAYAWYAWQEKAKTQAEPVWISTDFMKPDESDLVLGISTTKLAKFNFYQVVALDEFDECAINYWMPLPTAPSESGAEV